MKNILKVTDLYAHVCWYYDYSFHSLDLQKLSFPKRPGFHVSAVHQSFENTVGKGEIAHVSYSFG